MGQKLNIGVLGCANIADRFMLPTICELSANYKLAGVASRDEKKANLFAEKYNCNAFYDYESLINDSTLNAIYIPLPNSLHYEWIKKSLNKRLHVLVEKSLACSHEDVVELNELARENNLLLIENFQFRFHSQLKSIKDMLDNGRIGELRNMRSSFGFPPFEDKGNIRYKKTLGGGALLDAGAYTLKVSQMFLGNEICVDSASLYYDEKLDVDIWGSAYIKQKEGKLASQVAFGFDSFYQCSLELWGSKGKIFANRLFTSPPGFSPTVELETASGKELIELKPDDHFKNMLLHFYEMICNYSVFDDEYKQNINQSRLVRELEVVANK